MDEYLTIREIKKRFRKHAPAKARRLVTISTATSSEKLPIVRVKKLVALKRARRNFAILSHSFPAASGIDGVLVSDFFKNTVLSIDFKKGKMTLR